MNNGDRIASTIGVPISKKSSSRRIKSAAAANDDNDQNIEALLLNSNNTPTDDTAVDAAAKMKRRKKKSRSVEAATENTNNTDTINGTTAATTAATTTATSDTTTKRIKKKKSKQRSSSEKRRRSSAETAESSAAATSDNEFSPESSSSKSSSTSSGGGDVVPSSNSSSSRVMGGEKLRDSLTLMNNNKESKLLMAKKTTVAVTVAANNGNTTNQRQSALTSPARQTAVQFTSSTLQRDSKKKLLVNQVLGGEVVGEDDDNTEEDDNNSGKGGGNGGSTRSIGSASGGGSALKKESKYSGSGSGGGVKGGKVKSSKKLFHSQDDDDEEKDATDLKSRGNNMFKIPSSFELKDNDDDDDNNNNDNNTEKEPSLRNNKSRKEMFARAAHNSSLRKVNNNNKQDSSSSTSIPSSTTFGQQRRRATAPPLPQEPRRASAPPLQGGGADSSSSSDDDDDNEESPRRRSHQLRRTNSLSGLGQRPAISRRSSLRTINVTTTDGEDTTLDDARSSLIHKINAVKQLTNTPNQKELRRVQMSMEKQIFIPPKNRNKGILAALSHLLAGRVAEYVLWTYKAAFGKVMLMFLTIYVVNIFTWAGIMDAVDRSTGGRCIHDDDFATNNFTSLERYEFAFELSWTTFTTVGYGAIGPAPDVPNCYPVRLVCAFVAFTGVLFGSTTAAIMYSKLMRLLARAHVTFSSTLCVQFGRGNEGSTVRFGQFNFRASVAPAEALKALSISDLEVEDSDDDENKREDPLSTSDEGFPVIEFRMVNDRANHEGSEIWDAQIRGIIQLNKDVNPSTSPNNAKATGGESTLDLDKKAYYQFALTPDSHPHFSRIWYARHVLNAESPLLKRDIRDEIVKEGGKWDKDYNTASEVRKCLNEFISLRITLSGTSAVSANTVFAEHVYEYEDVVVGWRFANMVYEKEPKSRLWKRFLPFGRGSGDATDVKGNRETKTKVDKALIHDIVPQPGDDYEIVPEASTHAQISRLFQRGASEIFNT